MVVNDKRLVMLLVLGALCAPPVPADAQEWTRFRGPNGAGISDASGIPVSFAAADYNWRVALPGVGASSPVLWGRRIFVTSAEPDQGRRHLLCLDTADGRTLWTRPFPFATHPKHQFNGYASSTPAVDADHVYVLWTEPGQVSLHALDHQGKEIWKCDLGSYHVPHGGGASPVVVGDRVIVALEQEPRAPAGAGGDSAIIGVDRKTGEIRWKHPYPAGTAGYATPAVYQPEGGAPEVICTGNRLGIVSLNPRTGAQNWAVPRSIRQRCVASPVLANGRVFQTAGTGGGDKQLVVVRLETKAQSSTAALDYEIPRDVSYVPTPIAYGDRLFIWGDGGIVSCLKAATGEILTRERVGGTYFGSPVCVNGKLYAMNTSGQLVVVEAADSLKLLGKSDLGEESQATPAIAGGVMYLRTAGHLIAVGGRKRQAE